MNLEELMLWNCVLVDYEVPGIVYEIYQDECMVLCYSKNDDELEKKLINKDRISKVVLSTRHLESFGFIQNELGYYCLGHFRLAKVHNGFRVTGLSSNLEPIRFVNELQNFYFITKKQQLR